MRSFAHWTPRYVVARALEMVDHRANPHHPWLTRLSVRLIDDLLRPTDIGLEFGSGRSSRWFSRRI